MGHLYKGSDNHLILNLVILIVTFSLIIFIFNWIIRRLLNVEHPKFFSNNYVNDKHKKYDKRIGVISFIGYMTASFYLIFNSTEDFEITNAWYLFIIGTAFLIVQELMRAYMEWKYLKGKNDYLFTLIQLIFITAIIIIVLKNGFFGVFNL